MSNARGQDGETGDGIKLLTDEKNANALRGLLNGEPTLAGYLTAHRSRLGAGDYFALLAYIEMNEAHERALQAMRVAVRARRVATCVEFGPRNVVRRERRLGRAGASFWIDVAIVAEIISFAFAAHLVEIALWALLFKICGEFPDFGTAFDHSALNYTTLGYGDVIRRGDCWDRWRQQTECSCSVSRRL